MIFLDTETARIEPGLRAPPVACVTWADERGNVGILHYSEALPYLRRWFDGPCVLQSAHFDCLVYMAEWPELIPVINDAYSNDRVTCTWVRDKLIAIADTGYTDVESDLDAIAKRHDVPLRKLPDTWRLRFGELRPHPLATWPQDATAYAMRDAAILPLVWRAQEQRAELLRDQYRKSRAMLWMAGQSAYGMLVDGAQVDMLQAVFEREMAAVGGRLIEGGLLNPGRTTRTGKYHPPSRDTKAAKRRLHECLTALDKAPQLTAGGEQRAEAGVTDLVQWYSLDGDALERAADPLLADYSRYSELMHAMSTEIPMLREHGIIQARFALAGSGRSRSTNPNVQNWPRKPGVREAVMPRPGYVYVTADAGGLELATMAECWETICGHSALAEEIRAGLPSHDIMGAAGMGLSLEDFLARKKAGDPEADQARQVFGKVVGFGRPGGLGRKRLVHFAKSSYDLRITEEQADVAIKTWERMRPEAKTYFAWVDSQIKAQGGVWQLYAERYRGGGLGYTEACNTMFQGLGADAMLDVGWHVWLARWNVASPLYGCPTVNFAHDEFICEAPEERAHEAATELGRIMVERGVAWLPRVQRLSTEPCVTRRWSKFAKPKRDSNGRLVPWEPRFATVEGMRLHGFYASAEEAAKVRDSEARKGIHVEIHATAFAGAR